MQFAGFRPVRMANGSMALPGVEYQVIAASQTITLGDAVVIGGAAGAEVMDNTSDVVGGYAVGFLVDYGGKNLPLKQAATNSNYVDGTYTAATTGDTYAAAADNVTDKKVAVAYIPAEDVVCSAREDATPATTTGSATPGYYLDILTSDATYLDESTASTTAGNFLLVAGRSGASAIDPTDSSRVMCRAGEVEL